VSARRATIDTAGITLAQTFDADVPNVLADREQLSHALEEIVDNAVKAMRGGKGELTVSVEAIGSELVKLRVVDTGRGIAPEHIDKVFEPFFTTKNDWHGQGLGLTAAHQVIEAHHGTIKLESRLGHGTAVTVVLPAMRPGAHLQ
jgi:two-component system, NtrC family, sensor kinase